MAELRREIASYLERRFQLRYDFASQIIVTVGGSEGIDLALRCMVDPGDEVIVPVPSFVCYGPLASTWRGHLVYVETKVENEFRLLPEELRSHITPRTKVPVLPSPQQPHRRHYEQEDRRPSPKCCGARTSWISRRDLQSSPMASTTSPSLIFRICMSAPLW